MYSGPGGLAPSRYFSSRGIPYQEGYNVADYLLDVASDPPVTLFQTAGATSSQVSNEVPSNKEHSDVDAEKGQSQTNVVLGGPKQPGTQMPRRSTRSDYAATFLTQLEVLSSREWKILKRDFTLFFTHVAVASVLGVFCGRLYF